MPDNKHPKAYDIEYSHIVREIFAPITIYASHNSTEGKCLEIDALWDTGATHSVFSPKVVEELSLQPIDTWVVGGIGKEKISDVVIAAILLPNGTLFTERRFSVNQIPGADVIIGMDIISMGDFVITNAKGKTLFSFVIPTLNNKISFKKLAENE